MPHIHKILVCGDRNWTNSEIIRTELQELNPTIVVGGEARGADSLAAIEAIKLGIRVRAYTANWIKYGRAAGPIRNREQFDIERPNLVLAFHNHLATSKGTKDMINYAKSKGCEVRIIGEAIPSCKCCS